MDIREKTGIIIRRGCDYLVGRVVFSRDLKWSQSPWDAWITRSAEEAERVCRWIGGEMMLFNPIVGQIREYRRADK